MIMTSGVEATDRAAGTGTRSVGRAETAPQAAAGFSNILACIDNSPQAGVVLDWAAALARRLPASLGTLCVLDTAAGSVAPHDPIGWEMRRIEARSRSERLLDHACAETGREASIEVSIGPFEDRFRARLEAAPVDLCLVGAVGEGRRPNRRLGDTARYIVEAAPCSVLVVPPRAADHAGREPVNVRRLMVPLDCSRRAESALPAAIALAEAFGAEMVMAHALPEPAITEIGPPDAAGIALRREIAEHNQRAAARYMSRLRARLALDRRPIRTLVLNGADPRHRLARAAAEEGADLVVLAAKGAGGYADQALGSVADFLLTHLGRPLLIVRPGAGRRAPAVARRAAPASAEASMRNRS